MVGASSTIIPRRLRRRRQSVAAVYDRRFAVTGSNIPNQRSPRQRASPAIALLARPALDSHAHIAISPRTTPGFARHHRRNLFANAALRLRQSATLSTGYFLMISSIQKGRSGDHPVRRKREDGRHEYVTAGTRAVLRAFFSEADKSFVNRFSGQYRPAVICARRHKIDRRPVEHPIEAM